MEIQDIENYNELREFAIDEFIKKYDNDYRIVSYKLREAIDSTHFMRENKYLAILINYENTDYKYLEEHSADGKIKSYSVLNNVNYIDDKTDEFFAICGYNESKCRSVVTVCLIYLNLKSLIRKYKIRHLV